MKDDTKKTIRHIFRTVERNRPCSMISRAQKEAEEAEEQKKEEQEEENR